MGRLFGTDGIRGIAGSELTAECGYKLGLAVAEVLTEERGAKPRILIGKDTRHSGDMFEAAIAAGLCAMGSDVTLLGVVPTPAVAFLVRALDADAGIMISASHNPSEYNGLKVFSGEGYKLSDALEEKIEAIILGEIEVKPVSEAKIGCVTFDENAAAMYEQHVISVLDGAKQHFSNPRRILFDLSNGSATRTAPKIFSARNMDAFSAEFVANDPDGFNINRNCGSTHIDRLAELVVTGGYSMGIAFDGDADRCLAVDEKGNLIDGDMIIAAIALEMKRKGTLHQDTAVVTKLSNLGFHIFAEKHGIHVAVTDVGDRYVLEEMLRSGANIGGEQSGHIIMTDYATTGDGEVTAAVMLSLLASAPEKSASEVFGAMKSLPQVSRNVHVENAMKKAVMEDPGVLSKRNAIAETLGGKGRILLRPSGTEALIRIMLEGEDISQIRAMAEELADMIEAICGQH